MSLRDDYEFLSNLATLAEAGGLAKERSVLLLWFFRNIVGLDDLDAYEYVCDGDADGGIDGLRLESSAGDEDFETLVIYQSKYTTSPSQVGPNSIARLLACAEHFKDAQSLRRFVAEGIEPKLEELVSRFRLIEKLDDGAYDAGHLRVRLVLVTTGILNQSAQNQVEATNTREFGHVATYDLCDLGPLARAVAVPDVVVDELDLPCVGQHRLIAGSPPNRVALAVVRGTDIVGWPGISDRSLFALNVRRELPRSTVSRQLDGAIGRSHDHPDFLAYHNGLTMVCDSFDVRRGGLRVVRPSIVNGTQSVLALVRGSERGLLTDDLRIFVKVVEVATRPQLAKEVSWRSNTQAAVNARNLMALGGPQERIRREFEASYPEVLYETRPDASLRGGTATRVISNDDAAQLLCAVYNAMPWLAVKRLALFDSENHATIFPDHIHADHVYFSALIRDVVDKEVEQFPDRYRQSWRLTRLVAVYLVGQLLRTDDDLQQLLNDPAHAVADIDQLKQRLRKPARIAAGTLKQRADYLSTHDLPDEFNREFKNRETLNGLRDNARANYNLLSAMGDLT